MDLIIKKRKELKPKPKEDHQYVFGGISTDHMLEIDYIKEKGGWQIPVIKANEPFMLDPQNSTFHYSL